jgi:hypothetical protein
MEWSKLPPDTPPGAADGAGAAAALDRRDVGLLCKFKVSSSQSGAVQTNPTHEV